MPNTNPVGPFQPMENHPLTRVTSPLLGADALYLENLQSGTYTLIERPTNEQIVRLSSLRFLAFTGTGAAGVSELRLFLKKDNKEYLLPGFPPGPAYGPGEQIQFSFLDPFQLSKDGYFDSLQLRVAALPGADGINFYMGAEYVRNEYMTSAITLVENTQVPLIDYGANGWSRRSLVVGELFQTYGGFFNFDSNPHTVDVFMEDSAGNIMFFFTATLAASPTPGVQGVLQNLAPPNILPPMPHDMRFVATLDSPGVNGPVEAFGFYSLTNEDPVKSYQGGAY